MLAYIPVRFDVYLTVQRHLRWTLQNLVAFADHAGRCFPSVRKLAAVTGSSKSAVSRHLKALERDGALTRHRRPGGVFTYQIASRFLPSARVSHRRDRAVPRLRTEENVMKNRSDSALPDQRAQWQARMRSWKQSRFWLPQWGPRPGEAGCFAPGA
jgi:DNA-binding transcriptional ArsR family regulator